MDNSIELVRLILITLFCIYQFWAFRNNKPLKIKLFPMILLILIGVLIVALFLFIRPIGYFFIFIILCVELSLRGAMLVVLLEALLVLRGSHKDMKRFIILICIFFVLAVVYVWGERIF